MIGFAGPFSPLFISILLHVFMSDVIPSFLVSPWFHTDLNAFCVPGGLVHFLSVCRTEEGVWDVAGWG